MYAEVGKSGGSDITGIGPADDGKRMLAAASEYAAAGFPVFPCGPDKKPLIAAWPTGASTDAVQVRRWWTRWPEAMIGLVTGARSGLYVVDIDVKGGKDGMAAYQSLKIPKAQIAALTPSRGGHAYFCWPCDGWGNTASKIGPGIDTRGEGGYVIAPPSQNANGTYHWVDDTMGGRLLARSIPELPEKLRSMLAPDRAQGGRSQSTPSGRDGWATKALREEVDNVLAAAPGCRNDVLNRAAFNLGQIVGGGALDRPVVESELMAAAVAAGLGEREAAATLRSSLDAGLKQPRRPKGEKVSSTPVDEVHLSPEPDLSLLEDRAELPPVFPGASVFGDVWGAWIGDAARAASAPPDYVGMALLAVAGSLVGNARWVKPWRGWSEPPVVRAMLIGNPSAGKSPALKAITTPLRALERRVREAAELTRNTWLDAVKAAEAYQKAWEREVDAAVKAGRAPPPRPPQAVPPEEPHVPRLMVNDVTTEVLGVILGRQPRGTLMVRDELAGFFGDMNRYNNGSGDRPFWLEAYGGGNFSVERLSRDPVTIDSLTVGVLGGIQPDRLAGLLMKAGNDDGMLARFCPVFPHATEVRIPERAADLALAENAFSRLYDLEMAVSASGKSSPILVQFNTGAAEAMQDFYGWVRASEGEHAGLLKSYLGKTPGMVVRIALLLDLLEWAVGPAAIPPSFIGLASFERARRFVTDYLFVMARRAYAEASTSTEERAARTLAQVLRAKRVERITRSEIMSLKREGLRDRKAVTAALDLLQDANIVRELKIPTGGHPRIEYVVDRRIWG